MNPSHTVSISIDRDVKSVYAFLADPANIPQWSVFIQGMEREGDGWRATTPDGPMRLQFVESNSLGVLDHWVWATPEQKFCVPFRVVPNGAGSEVLLTVFQHPGMSEEQFARDISMVETDFRRLRELLERGAVGSGT